jgi:hypothetical protein
MQWIAGKTAAQIAHDKRYTPTEQLQVRAAQAYCSSCETMASATVAA